VNREVRNHRDLIAWQRAMDFVELIYKLSASFPADERFGLTSQIRRAAVSVPSNIAEGAARRSRKEFAHFVSIALASAVEIDTHLELALRLGFVSPPLTELEACRRLTQILVALRKSLNEPKLTNHESPVT
jgi:four helix bundle protein